MNSRAQVAPVVRFGAFEVNIESGELFQKGVRIRLQEQPFRILCMLLERPGEVVTRDEIKQRLWPSQTFVDFDHGVNTAIRRLRQALSDSADVPRLIETIPRHGYRFLGEVSDRSEAPQMKLELVSDSPTATTTTNDERADSQKQKWRWVSAAVIGLIAVIGSVLALTWHARLDSVAVLPFVNESREANLELLGDGIAARVGDMLSGVEGLRVASNNSARRFKQETAKPQEIGRALRVRALVLGAIRRVGPSIEVQLEIVDTEDDRHLWGKTYRVSEAEVGTLEGAIVKDVVEGLDLKVSSKLTAQLERERTNAVAYQAFLRGDGMMDLRDNANFRRALGYFESAVDADPNYALGYLGMGKAYGLLGAYGGMPMTEAGPLAEASFDRALQIDPKLAAAHAFKAVSLMTIHRNLPAAERELKRAFELNPNEAGTYKALAELYVRMKRLPEARQAVERAGKIDPFIPGYLATTVQSLRYEGRGEEALAIAKKDAALKENHVLLASLYNAAGKRREALVELSALDLAKMQVPESICMYARELAIAGERSRAEAALRRGIELGEQLGTRISRSCTAYSRARYYAVVGDREKMYMSLEQSARELEPYFGQIVVEPEFDGYRMEPRFQAMVKLATTPR